MATATTHKRDRQERFNTLANRRVNKVLHDLKLIGNLADRSNYGYSQEQADKITQALAKALEEVKTRFNNDGESEPGFSLNNEKSALGEPA